MRRALLIVFTILWYAASIGVVVAYVKTLIPMISNGEADKILDNAIMYYFIVVGLCLMQMLLTWLTGRLYDYETYNKGSFIGMLIFCIIAPVCLVVNMVRTFKNLWILFTQSPD